ncbi:Uncharacterized membrane-anchored protein conserved in bacteria [Pannonibacter phragmitetus]|uniref:Uncharacterized membrane-anchored protein conserved in bacteria n=1 Tax=Pannonibacter phragmitetus TaxID=121719 RepID=A0A378ZTE7_9HYPH|nr:DUF3422 domain-containing protein [Pannonibacter phragmitetus]SUA99831.1 Uncharacterized membrane-anchored protein conserved in bacteria [Pannonibacter phragmitetus]
MNADANTQQTGGLLPFGKHHLRAAVLGELHARPFRALESPRILLHYAFTCDPKAISEDRIWFADLCRSQGVKGPGESDRSHVLPMAGGSLRWEQHSEFITYTFDVAPDGGHPFGRIPAGHPFGSGFRAPGPMLVAARLDAVPENGHDEAAQARWFDRASLAALQSEEGRAVAMTDFRQDGEGLTRILLIDRGMAPSQTGALAQRLIEVETYRTLALLGLPMATELSPDVRRIEEELVRLTGEMRGASDMDSNRHLLERLSDLAADLEAGAAASAYRFGASRAYHSILKARLETIEEAPVPGYLGLASFLARRIAPAMRTIESVENRQINLSRKLARATTLLRTRVDVDMERQNRDLLDSMNRRARLQLRLQQTVEGLSVAAVSYYVVGLVGYLAKGLKEAGVPMPDPGLVSGMSVPLVLLAVWWTVRRIRAHHTDTGEPH